MNPQLISCLSIRYSFQRTSSTYNSFQILSNQFFFQGDIMKLKKMFFVLFFLTCLFPLLIYSQDVSVHYFIGKPKSDVIKKYGNPAHQDNSNPDMMCMFYQTKTTRMIFVSNKDGVFQSEATINYETEAKARNEVNDCIKSSVAEGFKVDTVSVNDFQLYRPGVKADLQMSENKISKTYDVSVKAHKSED